ncbi:MAG TPA: lamin tail domain-containing protein [Kofleriaceae bacterium]|nr:lamin tail domain-containing protein [Kofleriaceae bacterium]
MARVVSLRRVCFIGVGFLAACGALEDAELIDDLSEPLDRLDLVAVQPRGTGATLDVANWNLEWFGDTGNGPTNEALQLANARDTIQGTDFDVWSLEEVASASAFRSLVGQLPGYAGVIASDPVVAGGTASYSAGEQKPALVYKTSLASLVSARIILTASDSDFAGRPPLEVKLSVTLGGVTQERIFIVLHMKAFADTTSWQRRASASAALKSFLDATYPTQRVIVLGDWNDDLDTSITSGRPTPYANLNADPGRYTFLTRVLTDAGVATTCDFSDAIDHQLVTNEIAADRVSGSVEAYELDAQIPSYCNTTSDHFPVLVRYRFGGGTPPPPPPGAVILNEILANEPGSNTGAEFVEIVNLGGSAANLSGWQLRDATTTRHTFAPGTTLAAGKAIVVFASAASIPAGTPGAIAASTGALSLANGGDSVVLRDAAGATVDSNSYSSSLSSVDGVSMNRSPDATAGASFALHTSVSGLASSPGRRASGAGF